MSAQLCTFATPKKSRTVSSTSVPLLPQPIVPDPPFEQSPTPRTPSFSSPGQYRRNEKDFASTRSSNDPRGARPSYRGDPSCQGFVDHFTQWVDYLKDEVSRSTEAWFDPSWTTLDSVNQQVSEPALEISIDTVALEPASRTANARPVTIKLPPYNHSTRLIQILESTIGHEQHYFRRKELRDKVYKMHQDPSSPQSKDHNWLCYWLAVIALGELYQGGDLAASEDSVPGTTYYNQSVALLPQVAETPDMQYIATLCLLSLFALATNRRNTAYMYVGAGLRAALALSMHRDPQEYPSERSALSEADMEHQRRLFWTVYFQDLLTTTDTGRPWGILDDEISVSYASSISHSGDMLLEFFDADEANQHLELMRIRGQGYSSLYGYAGTAINPQSHICLLRHELGEPLTSQHLDKIAEFIDSFASWESELSPAMKIGQDWNNVMTNLNRFNAHLYLIYYQSILVMLRPALVSLFNEWYKHATKHGEQYANNRIDESGMALTAQLLKMYTQSLNAARQASILVRWLSDQGALLTYSYQHSTYLFTTAITLYIARAMSTQGTFGMYFTLEDHAHLSAVAQLLQNQAAARSPPAMDFTRRLESLDSKLQVLGAYLHDMGFSNGGLSF
ncbi:putative transcriptional regulatory protein [Cyphellophora attinorum]|uniref:Putative transcriptional regulatory protein n=1 Tax=Cyphellophora attinorum TaxID=1664694 RepID=A0A0N1HP76_9EURO|nr:putative transcriptional regulatory protein [Phialophora attinorum]KPI39485.1 putative transcriptional regulatory protein [Phialophora attinorum]